MVSLPASRKFTVRLSPKNQFIAIFDTENGIKEFVLHELGNNTYYFISNNKRYKLEFFM